MQERQESPVYSLDPDLVKAYRKAFMSGRRNAPVVLHDLLTTFRFWEKDQYEDSKMQARVLGQRDVLLEILRKCGVLEDTLELTKALAGVYAKPPEELPGQAEVGGDDLDLRE